MEDTEAWNEAPGIAGQTSLRALLARDEQEAMARRIIHYAQLHLLSRDELAQYVADRCAVAGAARAPFVLPGPGALYVHFRTRRSRKGQRLRAPDTPSDDTQAQTQIAYGARRRIRFVPLSFWIATQ